MDIIFHGLKTESGDKAMILGEKFWINVDQGPHLPSSKRKSSD